MLRLPDQLVGSRLLRACSLLAGSRVTGKTAQARARVLDTTGDDRACEWVAEEAAKRKWSISPATAQRLVAIAAKPAKRYRRSRCGDLAVVLAHFNPAGFSLPAKHLYRTCEDILTAGITPVVAQVVMPGRDPARLPDGTRSIVYVSESVLFHKENLFNLAAAATDEPKLLFLDGDLVFSRRDVFDAVSQSLDDLDVLQPFSLAAWTTREGSVCLTRPPAVQPLSVGRLHHPANEHPGFAWAMTRRAFDALGGFYDQHPLGGGDAGFAFSLVPGDPQWSPGERQIYSRLLSYTEYRKRAMSLRLRIGFVEGTVYHRWHGDLQRRRYEQRYDWLPQVDSGYPIQRRADGLLEWTSPEHDAMTLRYFLQRSEDG